ncbi:MAG: hypothetical protein KGI08_10275 [Thaumarchaeota archaeon]|nr:hypothetical protein [Nitrososphaerota archaeon]
MKIQLFLTLLVSCALLVHTAYATMYTGDLQTRQENCSLESCVTPAFFGIFTYQTSEPVVNSQPSISTSYGTTMTSNPDQDWLVQFNPFTPQNAYATFVSQVNQTVQSIFWGQFNFTEQKTNQGLSAMNQVLQNGGTSDQARNALAQNAQSSRSEITKVNNDLNVKYGNTSADVQSKFDKYGNLR